MTKPVVTFGTAAFAAFTYDDESRQSAAVRWPDWLERFKIHLDASGIENESRIRSHEKNLGQLVVVRRRAY